MPCLYRDNARLPGFGADLTMEKWLKAGDFIVVWDGNEFLVSQTRPTQIILRHPVQNVAFRDYGFHLTSAVASQLHRAILASTDPVLKAHAQQLVATSQPGAQ